MVATTQNASSTVPSVERSRGSPHTLDAPAARAFGQVAAFLLRSGRKPAARVLDALIAATAIANGLALYTCNPKDYTGIDDLAQIAIPHPDAT